MFTKINFPAFLIENENNKLVASKYELYVHNTIMLESTFDSYKPDSLIVIYSTGNISVSSKTKTFIGDITGNYIRPSSKDKIPSGSTIYIDKSLNSISKTVVKKQYNITYDINDPKLDYIIANEFFTIKRFPFKRGLGHNFNNYKVNAFISKDNGIIVLTYLNGCTSFELFKDVQTIEKIPINNIFYGYPANQDIFIVENSSIYHKILETSNADKIRYEENLNICGKEQLTEKQLMLLYNSLCADVSETSIDSFHTFISLLANYNYSENLFAVSLPFIILSSRRNWRTAKVELNKKIIDLFTLRRLGTNVVNRRIIKEIYNFIKELNNKCKDELIPNYKTFNDIKTISEDERLLCKKFIQSAYNLDNVSILSQLLQPMKEIQVPLFFHIYNNFNNIKINVV